MARGLSVDSGCVFPWATCTQRRWEGGCHGQAPCFSSPSSDLLENRLSRKKAQVCRVSNVCGLNTATAARFQVPVRAPV